MHAFNTVGGLIEALSKYPDELTVDIDVQFRDGSRRQLLLNHAEQMYRLTSDDEHTLQIDLIERP